MSFNRRTYVQTEINGQTKSFAIIKGKSLLEILQLSKVAINSSCGGQASCGTCKVQILDSNGEELMMNEVEKEFFETRSNPNFCRLACQIFPEQSLNILIPSQDLPK